MAEPRARIFNRLGQQNFSKELRMLLFAFGDDREPLEETVKILDEIVTDFIIESCHEAAACASYSRRQKVKVDDFRMALRRDPTKLGRVQELLAMDKHLKNARKLFSETDDKVDAGEAVGKLIDQMDEKK